MKLPQCNYEVGDYVRATSYIPKDGFPQFIIVGDIQAIKFELCLDGYSFSYLMPDGEYYEEEYLTIL